MLPRFAAYTVSFVGIATYQQFAIRLEIFCGCGTPDSGTLNCFEVVTLPLLPPPGTESVHDRAPSTKRTVHEAIAFPHLTANLRECGKFRRPSTTIERWRLGPWKRDGAVHVCESGDANLCEAQEN